VNANASGTTIIAAPTARNSELTSPVVSTNRPPASDPIGIADPEPNAAGHLLRVPDRLNARFLEFGAALFRGSSARLTEAEKAAVALLSAPDIMGYKDLNEHALTYGDPAGPHQRAINRWTARLKSHHRLFLADWASLDMDAWLGWSASETLRFYCLSGRAALPGPGHLKINVGDPAGRVKALAWRAMRGLVPGFIIERRKASFPAPPEINGDALRALMKEDVEELRRSSFLPRALRPAVGRPSAATRDLCARPPAGVRALAVNWMSSTVLRSSAVRSVRPGGARRRSCACRSATSRSRPRATAIAARGASAAVRGSALVARVTSPWSRRVTSSSTGTATRASRRGSPGSSVPRPLAVTWRELPQPTRG